MWEAMRSAEIGGPLWREDPYVNRLEEMAADLTGKETAMLVSTTSVANLLGMMSYCQRGHQARMEAAPTAPQSAVVVIRKTNHLHQDYIVF